MKRKRILAIIMTILILIVFSGAAFANDITDMQDQLEGKQGKIEDIKNTIGDLKDQIVDEQKQVVTLSGNISVVDKEIKDMQFRITDVQGKINVTTGQLNAAIDEYNKQDDIMKKRINAMYKNGTTVGYLQVIVESKNFSEFISNTDIMKKIMDYDINMLKDMKKKREEIDKKKAELLQVKAELVALKANLDSNKKDIVNKNQQMQTMISSLDKQKAAYEASLHQEEAAAEKMKKEIKTLLSKKLNYDGSIYAILHRGDFPDGKLPRSTSPFGFRTDPITGRSAYHAGLDIGTALIKNIPIYALAPGKVIIAKYYGGYGNAVVIDHGSGFTTLYGHCNSLLVSVGQTVMGGEKIALSGSTGRSTGPHVHFGVAKNGQDLDPEPYYRLKN